MVKEGGIGFLGLLTVALIVLKIMGHIESWWWVFAPIWIPLAFFGIMITVPRLINGIITYLEGR